MKEFVNKLISRLEEESDFFSGKPMGTLQKIFYCKGVECASSIVKELAAEYGKNTNSPTNADRIRSMTDKELAAFLFMHCRKVGSEKYALEWLQSEVEET